MAQNANEPKANYFLGLAAEQDGRQADAAAIWHGMLAKAPADAPWRPLVEAALARVGVAAAAPALSNEAMAAAKDMNDADRGAMIRGMVDRLATRLKQNGDDVEGWLRLMRAYMVMGERDKAMSALTEARQAVANDTERLRQLNEGLKNLGLDGWRGCRNQRRRQRIAMTRKQRRLTMIGGSLAVLAIAAALVLNAMRNSIVFFSTPTMAAEKQIPPGKRFRLGGLVQPGSLVRGDNLAVKFGVADGSATLPVAYKGILPDLFREGQGVVAEGALDAAGVFKADTVLAKHDETYMPKDVADALKKQGHWKDDYGAKPGARLRPRRCRELRSDRGSRTLRAGAGARRWR